VEEQGGALAGEAGEGPRADGGLAEVPRGADQSGALVVRFSSTNPDSIEREAQRLREMGLEEGVHFTVKMPEGGKRATSISLREGLAYAAWLSVYGKGEQQRELAAEFVELILQRAEEAGARNRRLRKSQRDRRGGQGEGLPDAGGL
jgi:Fe2+ transport system protein FeoA